MKPLSMITALAVAGALTAGPALTVYAADATAPAGDAVANATTSISGSQVLKASDDLYLALREVRAARIAIFNGATDEAATLANKALTDLKAAQASAADFAVQTNKAAETGDSYMPFDMSIALAEGFQPTEQKVAKIAEANKQIAGGDQKGAVETLKLANIDIVFNTAMLPVNVSVQHATDAVKLIGDGSYYEANLALKAIEDSVILDSYGIDSVPTQGVVN